MKRILLLCGGQSPEHLISIRSCKNILGFIDRNQYSITLIGISRMGRWVLLDEKELEDEVNINGKWVDIHPGFDDPFWCQGESLGYFDAIFPVLHGPNGEDGTIQGLIQLLGLPFIGSGILSSSICMDKDVTKRLLKEADIGVANWLTMHDACDISYEEAIQQLGDVLFVKPANMGSSVGVHKVTDKSSWVAAIRDAFTHDGKVLVEQAVIGRELECAVLGNQEAITSGIGEVKAVDFYSFEEKYADTSQTDVVIPAQLNAASIQLLKDIALKVYKVLNCRGLSRVDMFLVEDSTVLVNEVNTLPGFTSISMYPKLWAHEGLSNSELINRLIQLSIDQVY